MRWAYGASFDRDVARNVPVAGWSLWMLGSLSMSSFGTWWRVHVLDREERSRRPYIESPHEPVGIAPLRLALDDEGLAVDGELIVGRGLATSLARSSKVAVSAWMRVSPKPTIVSGRLAITRTDDRLAARRRVDSIDPERGERRVHRALEHRHQVRLPLISTRGRVQIGSGFDCTCSITQRANCWSTACLA